MALDATILKRKVFGIPVPILAVGAGVVGIIAFRRFGGGASKDSVASDAADYQEQVSGGQGSIASGGGSGGGGSFVPATSDTGGLYPQGLVNIRAVIRRRVFVNKRVRVNRQVREIRYRPGRGGKSRTTVRSRTITNPKAIRPNAAPGGYTLIRSTTTATRRGPGSNSRRVGAAPPIVRSR
jgi:hypothetical protein